MGPSLGSRIRLPPLKDLEGVAGPLYGSSCPSACNPMAARFSHWDSFTCSRAHTPLSPPLDCSPNLDSDSFDRSSTFGTRSLNIYDATELPATLSVPYAAEKSAGGWFDPSRWLFKLVFQRVGDKSIEELIKLMFYREARPRYGEDHTSTRSRKTEQLKADTPDSNYSNSKQTSSDAHKQQEQDRRWRHRTLQYETDECTGTYVCEAAEQMLPLIKDTINQIPREEYSLQDSDRKVKRLGKDEQLTAAALLPHISSILIFKLYDALEKVRGKFVQKENELRHEREARMHAEQQVYQSKRENERLLAKVQCREVDSHIVDRKRCAAAMDDDAGLELRRDHREVKWPKFEHTLHPGDRSIRCQLPLSPRSDGDEFTTSFSTTFASN